MTLDDYIDMFFSKDVAIEFAQQVLSIGREFLPTCALAVLDGGKATAEYWEFLASQVENGNDG